MSALKVIACPNCTQWNDPRYATCWNCDAPLARTGEGEAVRLRDRVDWVSVGIALYVVALFVLCILGAALLDCILEGGLCE